MYFNPSCSKCRSAKADLDAAGVEYVERRYLDDPPTVTELGEVLERLALEPWDIARSAETREAGIDLAKDAEHRDAWIAAHQARPARSSARRARSPSSRACPSAASRSSHSSST